MPYAVIRRDGTRAWSNDAQLTSSSQTGPGSYILEFSVDCREDVFVLHAKTEVSGCDGPSVVASSIQGGPRTICVAVSNLASPADRIDSQFSYIRYARPDAGGDAGEPSDGGCRPCQGVETRDWYAWINLMPPPPDDFHVTGEVYVPNLGVDPILTPKVPQGINPQILLLDLTLVQQPGIWPQVLVWKQARYDKVPSSVRYTQVQIFCGDEVIADIPVADIQ
jgi:hypothetical protein